MHRGLEAAGDAAVILAELALRPVGCDHRGQVVFGQAHKTSTELLTQDEERPRSCVGM